MPLELPREVRNLLEPKTEGDRFDRAALFQHVGGRSQPPLVQPPLRAASERGLRVALQLPLGDFESFG